MAKNTKQEFNRDIRVMWDLTCRQCKVNFEVEAPFGPTQEREMKCPFCGSKEIGRRELLNEAAPQCGG
jgi:rRNA maturation endonuclease Nob1